MRADVLLATPSIVNYFTVVVIVGGILRNWFIVVIQGLPHTQQILHFHSNATFGMLYKSSWKLFLPILLPFHIVCVIWCCEEEVC